jgi:hypothetical protein
VVDGRDVPCRVLREATEEDIQATKRALEPLGAEYHEGPPGRITYAYIGAFD